MFLLGLIVWIAVAFWPASIATAKGHSFIGYFLLSLIFFPLALLLALLSKDVSEERHAGHIS
jgi:hypothetical protein